jgi:hypothetical protein
MPFDLLISYPSGLVSSISHLTNYKHFLLGLKAALERFNPTTDLVIQPERRTRRP